MVADVDERIARLAPTNDPACQTIENAIQKARPNWHSYLTTARQELEVAISNRQFHLVTGKLRQEIFSGERRPLQCEAVVSARLKTVEAIIGKMQRFNEPLFNILDIWGFRIIVSNVEGLDNILPAVVQLWDTPTKEELALRSGRLQFQWLRDYRTRSHEGLSPATSEKYDEAVHINRRPAFGVVEIQIITVGLYKRAYLSGGEEAHINFAKRRRLEETRRHRD
jgi:hypothetical protein